MQRNRSGFIQFDPRDLELQLQDVSARSVQTEYPVNYGRVLCIRQQRSRQHRHTFQLAIEPHSVADGPNHWHLIILVDEHRQGGQVELFTADWILESLLLSQTDAERMICFLDPTLMPVRKRRPEALERAVEVHAVHQAELQPVDLDGHEPAEGAQPAVDSQATSLGEPGCR